MNIKKRVFSLLSSCYVVGCLFAQNILISTPATSLVLSAPEKGELKYIYYGAKLSDRDFQTIGSLDKGKYAAYPVYGLNCPSEVALAVKHNDGNMTLQLEVVKVESSHQDEANLTIISLKDKVYPFYVKMFYKAYQDTDIIEIWSEISHQEKKTVVLNQFASAYLPIRKGDVWLSHLYGAWANEGRLEEVPLEAGMKVIKNKDGVRNSHTAHAEVMFSLDGKPRENEGRVIGAALCYSGNYKLRIDTDESDYHHFFAGINEDNSTYNLKNGEIFRTPELALTYSDEGLSGSSRNFHRWARLHKLANGTKLRKILLNSWEGVYFKVNQKGMDEMMEAFSAMGGELFVMDDGWFGNKYPRNGGNSSLGDWEVCKEKLPEGVEGLLASARKHHIKFGIWIEPEMSNTKSELFEKHPDWILKIDNRPLSTGRGKTQVVLDLTNPKVQDFVFGVVDNLMTNYPEISYMKWDDNCSLLDYGSSYLPKNKQSHLYIEYNRGLQKVLQRIRAKYPELVMQLCAGGGARVNYGLLPYFDEFWTSDDTDALQRIYMQWGVSGFFPAIAMASHVSADKNHQTGRRIPLKFRFDVAMSGRLGMEIQPKDMNDVDKAFAKRAIAAYKDIRPVVQFGDLYRLVSPYDNKGVSSLMYVTSEKNKAVFYAYKISHFINMVIPKVCMNGLDPSKNYRLVDLTPVDSSKPCDLNGKIISGKILMEEGIALKSLLKSEYSSLALQLQAVD